MSRKIDLSKPLSDADRKYLLDRGRLDAIRQADSNGEPEWQPPADRTNVGGTSPDARDASVGAPQNGPEGGSAPEAGAALSDAVGDNVDNYDDEEAWSYDDLKNEVRDRLENGDYTDDGKIALNSSREDFVKWLREDDEEANEA